MVRLKNRHIKGSTLIESLVAIFIIVLVFSLGISTFTNTNTKKRMDSFTNLMELKREVALNKEISIIGENKLKTEEFVFQDSVCLIKKITLVKEEKHKSSYLKITPLKRK